MRGIRVQLALLVVLVAVVGALLHPLALLLAAVPFDTRGVIRFLEEVRSVIADALGWGVLTLLALMVYFVLRGRLTHRQRPSVLSNDEIDREVESAGRPRAVVAITAYNDADATAATVRAFKREPD